MPTFVLGDMVSFEMKIEFYTLCSNFDFGTSGQRSVLDLVLPVITISTAEFLLADLSVPADEAPREGWLLEMLFPFVYGVGISCKKETKIS